MKQQTNKVKTVGILGGMGAATDAYFRKALLDNTIVVESEREHVPVVLYSDPSMPGKNDYIMGKGPNPTPYIISALQKLQIFTPDFIVMPCNTIHIPEYLNTIKESIDIPILHLIKAVKQYVKIHHPEVKKIGLLATPATIENRLYQSIFGDDVEFIIPSKENQEKVWGAINGVKIGDHEKSDRAVEKAGRRSPANLVLDAAEDVKAQGAEIIIGGCTELPIALPPERLAMEKDFAKIPFIDTIKVLALATSSLAKGSDEYKSCLIDCTQNLKHKLHPHRTNQKLSKGDIKAEDCIVWQKYGNDISLSFNPEFAHLFPKDEQQKCLSDLSSRIVNATEGNKDIDCQLMTYLSTPKIHIHSKDKKLDLLSELQNTLLEYGIGAAPQLESGIMSKL
jgi:aspartate racemase